MRRAEDSRLAFRCELCGERTYADETHYGWHWREGRFVYLCERCAREYLEKWELIVKPF